jgi:hypothetical protein
MSGETWVPLLHELGTIIAAVAAAIAAASSLRNGKRLKNGHEQNGRSAPTKPKSRSNDPVGKLADWYKKPD